MAKSPAPAVENRGRLPAVPPESPDVLGGGKMDAAKVDAVFGYGKHAKPGKVRRGRKGKAAPGGPTPAPALSPAQEQYRRIKAQSPDFLLLFRMGDFYEAFFDDARTLANVCGLTLTTRRDESGDVAMCGVPYHGVEDALRKLIAAGHKAALAEPAEGEEGAAGREVARVVTPVRDEPKAEPAPAKTKRGRKGKAAATPEWPIDPDEPCQTMLCPPESLEPKRQAAAPGPKPERPAGDYRTFLARKSQLGNANGFEPIWMPDSLFDFQKALVEWAVRKGRAGIFADCGLGKTPMQLVWAENVVRRANKPVLILAPLAVSHQVCREAEKFGVEAHRSDDGKPRPNITVTNYERLDKFDPEHYAGAVLDEASIVKHWSGATQKSATRFLSKLPYRLLCTATPSPNDYVEMGTLSEALGDLTYSDMLATFFRQMGDDEKKKRATADDITSSRRLSWRVIQSFGQWVLRAHAFEPFWKWVSSWARACRKPSDLGPFDDSRFVLPRLIRRDHTVTPRTPPEGFLFTVPAFGLNQERGERGRTIEERSELVARLTAESDSAVVWCHLNPEGDRLEKDIRGAVQVKGAHSMEEKEERILAFLNGEARVLVTKPKIAGLGLNLQHCAHVVTFVDHSYEKFYQCVRRCWRYGQQRDVTLDVIATEGEVNVRRNMERKERLASQMFDQVIRFMNDALTVQKDDGSLDIEVPQWLKTN